MISLPTPSAVPPSELSFFTVVGSDGQRYLAPEVLLDEKGYGKHVDFWSLGVLLFEMCCGWSPFYAEQTQEMYRLICTYLRFVVVRRLSYSRLRQDQVP